MATKNKTGLSGTIKKKKTTTKKESLAELLKKASELGGKLYQQGKLKPL